ncbi:MAG: hypothetical protein JNL57_00395 [Bacteroidetes bacterium]|nr:hypothetical protein [Bacteroidota bacterium]
MEQLIQKIQELRSKGYLWNEISEQLINEGTESDVAEQTVNQVRLAIRKRNTNRGMTLLFIGAFICLAAMMYTFLVGHNVPVLYGGTLVGISIAFAGLVYIMG